MITIQTHDGLYDEANKKFILYLILLKKNNHHRFFNLYSYTASNPGILTRK